MAAWDVALDRLWGHYALSSGVVTRSLPLGDSDLVLDVGGGTGGVSARLRPSVRAVTVVEPSEPLTRRGRGVHRGVGFVVGDGRSLPVRTGSVDHVLLVEVLHHVDDAPAVLAEAARVLRPGGSILIEESEFGGAFGRLRRWAESVLLGGVWPRSRPELLEALGRLGFRGRVLEQEGFVVVAVLLERPLGEPATER